MRLISLGSAYFAEGSELAGYGTGPRRTRPDIGPSHNRAFS
jgi:hypothetical protein